mgnify:CR=1 FL=1
MIEPAARPKKATLLEVDVEGKATEYEDGSQPGVTCIEELSADLAKERQDESGKSRQQNFRGQATEGEQSVQMLHKGGLS